jgi:hypothetical protein
MATRGQGKRANVPDDDRPAKAAKVSTEKLTDCKKKAAATSRGVGKNDSDKQKEGQSRSGKHEQTANRSTRSAQDTDAVMAADDDIEDDVEESEEDDKPHESGSHDEDSQSDDEEDQQNGLTGQADDDNHVLLEALDAVAASKAAASTSQKPKEAAQTVQTGASKESGNKRAGASKPASSKNDSRHAAKARNDEDLRNSFGEWGGDKVNPNTGSMPRKKTAEPTGGASSSTVKDTAKSPAKTVAKTPTKGARRDLVLPGSTGKKKKQTSARPEDSDEDDVAPGGDLDCMVAQCLKAYRDEVNGAMNTLQSRLSEICAPFDRTRTGRAETLSNLMIFE